MFTKEDMDQIVKRGSSVQTTEGQVERFRKGFPWMDIVAPATPEKGIEVLDDSQIEDAVAYISTASVDGRCKFVPASGAASRMFKDIFAGMDILASGEDTPENAAASKLAASIEKFAFYTEELFGKVEDSREFRLNVVEKVLTDKGLGYGSKPKGVIRFHKYEEKTKPSWLAVTVAVVSLAFAAWMVPGLWGAPLKAVSAFTPPMSTQHFNVREVQVEPDCTDFAEGVRMAEETGRPVLLDFTGYGCVNCRKMEASFWTTAWSSALPAYDSGGDSSARISLGWRRRKTRSSWIRFGIFPIGSGPGSKSCLRPRPIRP